jgi:hypothetical protein
MSSLRIRVPLLLCWEACSELFAVTDTQILQRVRIVGEG